jgi:hypothetical protein
MTPDEKASLEMLIARNAESVKAESRKIKEARDTEKIKLITKLFMPLLVFNLSKKT